MLITALNYAFLRVSALFLPGKALFCGHLPSFCSILSVTEGGGEVAGRRLAFRGAERGAACRGMKIAPSERAGGAMGERGMGRRGRMSPAVRGGRFI